jgi:hypothetical protein
MGLLGAGLVVVDGGIHSGVPIATMSEFGDMHLSPLVRRTAIAAGVGVGTAGLLAGVLLLGPKAASILLMVVFVLVWPLATVIRHVADDAPYESPMLVAFCAAGAVLCLPGVVRLLAWGAVGVVVALIAALIAVAVDLLYAAIWDQLRRKRSYSALAELSRLQQLEDERLITSLQCPLSIEELCGVWCETTMTLADGAGPRDRQAVAEVRRICLDEFERRNPDGFQRWIEAGAATDPGTFLLPKPGE